VPISVEIGLHYFVKMTLDNYKFRLQSELNTCHKLRPAVSNTNAYYFSSIASVCYNN